MALVPDQKFSTFQAGGTPTTGDIIVGLRDGINTKFNWVLPSGVDSVEGTANQVLVDGSSGTPVTGDVTLSLPQDIALTSTPRFVGLNLSSTINGVTGVSDSTGLLPIATFTSNAGAVNYINLQNRSTGLGPVLSAAGSDTDIQLNLVAKGEGAVALFSEADNNAFIIFNGTGYQHETIFHFSNTSQTNTVTLQDSTGTLAYLSDIPAVFPAALTKVDDTNVTLTLGGTPATALLQAVSLTLGWTGLLSPTRGGTGVNNGSNTLTLAGTLQTSGAFNSVFTMTGATNVTFPTSGTLATTAGTVSSVSGTANRITSTGGTTPVIDISASYVGQSSITTLGTIGTGVWQGTLVSPTFGGTGVNNASNTLTLAGNLATSGAFASTFTMTGITTVTFPTSGTLATTSQLPTPSALTKTDDTNVTITLGGTPATSLLQAVSLTMGWTGLLSPTRGGTGVNNGSSTLTLGGNHTLSGAFSSTFTLTNTTSVTFPVSGTLATTAQLPVAAALTKTDDTNVTLTLGGTPATALLQATSLTLGWTGTLSGTRGGTGVNNGSATFTMAGSHVLSGAFTSTFTFTNTTAVTFPTSGTLATTSQIPTGAALTKTDDTNVTLTLGGSPTTALVNAASLTLGWTGTLAPGRGGTGLSSYTVNGIIYASNVTSITQVTPLGNAVLVSNVTGIPSLSQTLPNNLIMQTPNSITLTNGTGLPISGITGLGTGVGTALGVAVNGSGAISLTTSATFVTPILGAASATSLTFSSTSGIIGTTTNNTAAVGSVGYIYSSVVANNTVSLTTNTNADVTSLSLPAGDYDCWGNVAFNGNAATSTIINLGWISLTSATLPSSELYADQFYSVAGSLVYSIAPASFCVPGFRVSLAAPATLYLTARSSFSINTTTAGGGIYARVRR